MKILRANIWWNTVVPQVVGWVYFCWLQNGINVSQLFYPSNYSWFVARFFAALICISAFGYLLNDWCDIKSDAVSGKENLLSHLHPLLRAVVVLFPLVTGCFFWMPLSKTATVLFVMQIISLIAYSVPPLRLKNKNFWGVAADAFYGHINPVFITLFTFGFYHEGNMLFKFFFALVLLLVAALKGTRNILLHQLHDRKNDFKAGIQTFAVKNGAMFSLNLVNRLLLPELILTVILSLLISFIFPPFFICLLLFIVITYLKFSGWKLAYLPKRQLKFKFLYFLNDYYEGWVPVFFLVLLSVHYPLFLLALLLHLILFSTFLSNFGRDLKTIQQNFKTEDQY